MCYNLFTAQCRDLFTVQPEGTVIVFTIPTPRRHVRWTLQYVVLVASMTLLALFAVGHWVDVRPNHSFRDGALALCNAADVPKTPAKRDSIQAGYKKFSNAIGTPSQILVTPMCTENPDNDPATHEPFDVSVVVYIVLEPSQLSQQGSTEYQNVSSNKNDEPIRVDPASLPHLLTDEQREEIERETQPDEVHYFVIEPRDTEELSVATSQDVDDAYEKMTFTRDLLSGKYYIIRPPHKTSSVTPAHRTAKSVFFAGVKD